MTPPIAAVLLALLLVKVVQLLILNESLYYAIITPPWIMAVFPMKFLFLMLIEDSDVIMAPAKLALL